MHLNTNLLITGLVLIKTCAGQWTTDDLQLYDLVEEVGRSFYDVFEIQQDASSTQIRRAYHKLSRELHPDKNSAEDATERFRQVAAIYDVLKNKESREKYNAVLADGLPTWRQPLYYYRRMRKVTWYEGLLILLFIGTIAHYCMMWGAYYEKVLNYQERLRKARKAAKKDDSGEKALLEELEAFKPKLSEILPIILVKGTINLGHDLVVVAKILMKEKEPEVEEEVEKRPQRTAAPRSQQPEFKFEVAKGLKAVTTNDPAMEKKYAAESAQAAQKQAGSAWSPEELASLVKLSTEKFPVGTPNRWEQMGRVLNRTAEDVIAMAGKMKQMRQEDYTKLLMSSGQQTLGDGGPMQMETEVSDGDEWTQTEQKDFENALLKYPKGADERWDRISEAIGTKTKKQVITRFKYLVEMTKKKKSS